MQTLGYYDGKYDEIDKMVVPFDDRSHYYGDGVYDATCAGNHVIFNLDEHVDRFFNSAALLKIEIPHTKQEVKDILNEMVKKVDGDELFVYWQGRCTEKSCISGRTERTSVGHDPSIQDR